MKEKRKTKMTKRRHGEEQGVAKRDSISPIRSTAPEGSPFFQRTRIIWTSPPYPRSCSFGLHHAYRESKRISGFEPQIVKKHQRDVSSIEGKILALYGRGMNQRDIASTVEDIYGFKMSLEQISHITDCILEEVNDWQRRPLKPCYPFVFVDCLYVSLRTERGVQQSAVHVILAYDTEGCKDVLGLWINEVESKHAWMQIFDELKARGLKEIGF